MGMWQAVYKGSPRVLTCALVRQGGKGTAVWWGYSWQSRLGAQAQLWTPVIWRLLSHSGSQEGQGTRTGQVVVGIYC